MHSLCRLTLHASALIAIKISNTDHCKATGRKIKDGLDVIVMVYWQSRGTDLYEILLTSNKKQNIIVIFLPKLSQTLSTYPRKCGHLWFWRWRTIWVFELSPGVRHNLENSQIQLHIGINIFPFLIYCVVKKKKKENLSEYIYKFFDNTLLS